MTSIQKNKPTAELLNFLEIKDVYYKISDYLSLPELFTLEKVSKEFQRYITSRANEFIPLSFSIFSTSLKSRFFGSNNQELNEICKSVQTTPNQENLKSLFERMMKPTAQRLITATKNTEALHKTEKPAVVNDVFTILTIQKRTNPLFNSEPTVNREDDATYKLLEFEKIVPDLVKAGFLDWAEELASNLIPESFLEDYKCFCLVHLIENLLANSHTSRADRVLENLSEILEIHSENQANDIKNGRKKRPDYINPQTSEILCEAYCIHLIFRDVKKMIAGIPESEHKHATIEKINHLQQRFSNFTKLERREKYSELAYLRDSLSSITKTSGFQLNFDQAYDLLIKIPNYESTLTIALTIIDYKIEFSHFENTSHLLKVAYELIKKIDDRYFDQTKAIDKIHERIVKLISTQFQESDRSFELRKISDSFADTKDFDLAEKIAQSITNKKQKFLAQSYIDSCKLVKSCTIS